MQETPNLRLLFEDDFGLSYVHIIDDVNTGEHKHIIHSHVKEGFTRKALPQILEYSAAVDESFKEKGIKTLYTWASNEEEEKYAKILGYTLTGKTVEMKDETGKDLWRGPEILEYAKEL